MFLLHLLDKLTNNFIVAININEKIEFIFLNRSKD